MNTPQPAPQYQPISRSLSKRLVVTAELLFTGGVSIGWLHYVHRSATPLRHMPGSNAWWQHAIVAAAVAAVLGAIWVARRRRRIAGAALLAPLGQSAAKRITLLFRQAPRRPLNFGRALLATPLLLLFMFGFFRAGYQITSGLDPNNTVNAWGGPTYIGALACHYLDIFVGMAGSAWLLSRLLPRTRRAPDVHAAPGGISAGAAEQASRA
jgi:hypothetical protein